jgi:hypothetical protein
MSEYNHEVYFGNPSALDLGKMREEAERKQRGDAYKDPESTRIHHHGADTPCEGYDHEHWEV